MAWKGFTTLAALNADTATAAVTTDDTAVTVFASSAIPIGSRNVRFWNEEATPGWYSLDGGATWDRIPATYEFQLNNVVAIDGVKIRRLLGGTDLSIHASVW